MSVWGLKKRARKIPVIIATETPSASTNNSQSQDFVIDLCQSDNDYGCNNSKKRVLESSNGTLTSGSHNKYPRYIDSINDEEYDTVKLNFTQTELDDAGDDYEVVDATTSLTTNTIERKGQFYELLFDTPFPHQ